MSKIDPRVWGNIGKQLEEGRKKKKVRGLLAEVLQKKQDFWSMLDNEELWIYDGGYYKRIGEQIIKKELYKRYPSLLTKHDINEIISIIRGQSFKKRPQFDKNPFLLPVQNGLLNLKTQKLQEFSSDYFFTNKLPVKYDPEAKPKRIAKFMYEICDTQGKVRTIMEVVGMSLVRTLPLQKALLLVGEGDNGKSTILELIKYLLGPRNIASKSLQDLCHNRFSLAELYGKLANIHADLSDRDISYTGVFKMVTGKDSFLTAERKNKDPFKFTPYAPLFFSANKIPKAEDKTAAFYKRWCIIELPYTFVKNPQGEFEKKRDPNILKKLLKPEELSGFLNATIAGLQRVLKRNRLTISQNWEQVKEIYEKRSDQYSAFVKNVIVQVPNVIIPRNKVYNVYTNWVAETKFNRKPKNVFNRKLQGYVNTEMCHPTIKGERVRSWRGIYLGYRYFQDKIPKKHIRGDQTEL